MSQNNKIKFDSAGDLSNAFVIVGALSWPLAIPTGFSETFRRGTQPSDSETARDFDNADRYTVCSSNSV